MSRSVFCLVEAAPWRIARIATGSIEFSPVDADPVDLSAWANVAKEALAAAGWRGDDILLCLTSDSCLAGQVGWQLRRRPDRKALTFQLESVLPVAAEEVVADFVPGADFAFGVAIETSRFRPLVEALTAVGVPSCAVAPWAILAQQSLSNDAKRAVTVWQQGDRCELITESAGRLTGWSTLPANADAVVRAAR